MLNQKKIASIAVVMALLASTTIYTTNASAESVTKTTTTTDALGNKTTTWSSSEDKYWSETYPTRPYYKKTVTYNNLEPAYKYGYESYTRYDGKPFEQVEEQLRTEWTNARGDSTVTWEEARPAVRDSYTRTIENTGATREVHNRVETGADGTKTKTTTTTTKD